MADPSATFLELAGSLDHPLFIVTAAAGKRREGCVIGFATQCGFHPPRFLAFLLEPLEVRFAPGEEIVYFQAVKDAVEPGHPA